MARGRKTGGRVKGTPNKTTSETKRLISSIIDSYVSSGRIDSDLNALEPSERIRAIGVMLPYVMPKLASVDVDLEASVAAKSYEDKLVEMAKSEEI